MKKYLVLDIGGTYAKYALMNEEGEFLEKGKLPSGYKSEKEVIESLVDICKKYEGSYESIAMSLPGRIDTDNGIAHTLGSFMFIEDYPMVEKLQEHLNVPITIANDAKCAAKAEAWNGSLSDVKDGVVIVIGTGTGGGVILDGKVRMGNSFGSGELSHVVVDFDQLTNPDSKNERKFGPVMGSYLSTRGLLKFYKEEMLNSGKVVSEVDGYAFFEAFDNGEEEAVRAFDEFGRYAAAGIYTIQCILDVEKIAIGGGISERPEVTEKISEHVDKLWGNINFVPFKKPEIVTCKYRNDANLIGALSIHLDKIKAN